MSIKLHRENILNFLHITDTHLLDHPDAIFNGINTRKSLESVLDHCYASFQGIDLILFTGDISQTGNKQSYTVFASVIQRYNMPIYCVPGNHDTPELLQSIENNSPDSSISIVPSGQFELILINSRVDNRNHGMVTQQCLKQLDYHLGNSTSAFPIIAIHHPPALTNSKWLDDLGLTNKTELLQIINTHCQHALLLSGHVHQELDLTSDSVRILTTPSTCHQFESNCDHMHYTNNVPPAYRHVMLTNDGHIETKVYYIEEKVNHEKNFKQQQRIA